MMIGDVKRLVAQFYGLHADQLDGRNKSRYIAWPRQVAMVMCREFTRHSCPQIGDAFGGYDHTTILYAQRAMAHHAKEFRNFTWEIDLLRRQIGNGVIVRGSSLVHTWRATALAREFPKDMADRMCAEAWHTHQSMLSPAQAPPLPAGDHSGPRDALHIARGPEASLEAA